MREGSVMVGFGTLINCAGIIVGGVLGLLFGRAIKQNIQQALTMVCGIGTLFIGISGALEEMLYVQGDRVAADGTMLIVGCLSIGTFLGELLNIEGAFERFGEWLKHKTGNSEDNRFVEAFVTASLTVCIGAMAIVGAIEDGISGDFSILSTKAILDLVIIMVMTCAMGKGCLFSAIPVAFLQGSITLISGLLRSLMTASALTNLSMIGSILIFCVGVNLVWGKRIRVANMLPAVILGVIAAFLPF